MNQNQTGSLASIPLVTSQSPPTRIPRYYRLGGYSISMETAAKWAGRLKGRELHPFRDNHNVHYEIFPLLSHHRINFRKVGERENFRFMFVTQSGPFRGYRDMPSSDILQFEICGKDIIVKELLDSEGTILFDVNHLMAFAY